MNQKRKREVEASGVAETPEELFHLYAHLVDEVPADEPLDPGFSKRLREATDSYLMSAELTPALYMQVAGAITFVYEERSEKVLETNDWTEYGYQPRWALEQLRKELSKEALRLLKSGRRCAQRRDRKRRGTTCSARRPVKATTHR